MGNIFEILNQRRYRDVSEHIKKALRIVIRKLHIQHSTFLFNETPYILKNYD